MHLNISRLLKHESLASNIIFSIITSGMTFLSQTVLFIVLGQILSVEQFGTVGLAMTVANMVALLPNYGFDLFVIREIAQGSCTREDAILNITLDKAFLASMAIVLLALYTQLSGSVSQPVVFVIFGLSAICWSFTRFLNSVLKAEENFVTEAFVTTLQSVVQLLLISVSYFVIGPSVLLVAWLTLFSRIIGLSISILPLIHEQSSKDGGGPRPNLSLAWSFMKRASPFALQSALGTVYFQSDTILIGELLDVTSVGYYQAGIRLVTAFMRVPNILMSAFYPRIARSLSGYDTNSLGLSASRLLIHFLLLCGIVLTLLFGIGASPIIIAFYGEKMAPGIPVLRILSLLFVVRFVASGYGLVLISCHRQRVQLLGTCVAVVVNVGLNFLLIPRYGFAVAAWTNLFTNFLILCIYATFIRKILKTVLLRGVPSSARQVVSSIISFMTRAPTISSN